MAAERHVVGECDVVADDAVVGDMGARHHETAIADGGDAAALHRSKTDRHAFAELAVVADHQLGRLAAISGRLRRRTERNEWIDRGAFAEHGVAGDRYVGLQANARFQFDPRTDNAIRADLDVVGDPRTVGHARCRINARHAQASAIMAPSSASATTSPPTFASPRYHHMFRRRESRSR